MCHGHYNNNNKSNPCKQNYRFINLATICSYEKSLVEIAREKVSSPLRLSAAQDPTKVQGFH